MAYHSNGAFNIEQLYNMPVYLRNFYIKELEEVKKKEAEEMKKVAAKNKPIKR